MTYNSYTIYFFTLLALWTSQELVAKKQSLFFVEKEIPNKIISVSTVSAFTEAATPTSQHKTETLLHLTRNLKPLAENGFKPRIEQKNMSSAFIPFSGNFQPLVTALFSKSLVDYVLIVAILVIQLAIIVLYLFHRRSLIRKKRLALKSQEVLKFQITLAKRHIERGRIKQQELTQKLELTNKQVASYTFNYQQKNKIIKQIQEIVEKLEVASSDAEKDTLLAEVKRLTKENLSIDKNWEYFRNFFEEAQYGFHAKLLSKYPKLRPNDLKLCSLIRLNLSIKETAEILGISPGSVKTSRYRLRKKLNLEPKDEIIDHLISLEAETLDASPDQPDASGPEAQE